MIFKIWFFQINCIGDLWPSFQWMHFKKYQSSPKQFCLHWLYILLKKIIGWIIDVPEKAFQNVVTQKIFSTLSLKYEFLLHVTSNKIKLIWFCCILQATKFTVKNVAKQSYFAMWDAEIFSCNLYKTNSLLQSHKKITLCPEALK